MERLVTEKSVVSVGSVLETPCKSLLSSTEPTTRRYKFRQRFADEGLEDFESDVAPDEEVTSAYDVGDLDDGADFASNDLDECIQVGTEMEIDILFKCRDDAVPASFVRSDFFRNC
jgi:hypothetical protein